ncbi:hypothetical protein [Bradyrhizobium canariense]|uniref:hypothetical protein n=1 Tax=Bradyrhizobium canariense TaxID=255045 RepID=UPI001177B2F6|nr:hypothetical protein [Bradyrhizobium canariense]
MRSSRFLLMVVFVLTSTSALAQAGGGASGGGTGSGSTAAGSMSGSGTVNGTGGSPGPNTSNALNHETTGNRLGNPARNENNGFSSPASGYVNDPTMNKAVQDLGNTNTGIVAPKR